MHGGKRHVVHRRRGDGGGGLRSVEAEQLRRPGGSRHRQLQRVVEAAGHDRNLGAEPALDLVGDREGEQKVRTVAPTCSATAKIAPKLSAG